MEISPFSRQNTNDDAASSSFLPMTRQMNRTGGGSASREGFAWLRVLVVIVILLVIFLPLIAIYYRNTQHAIAEVGRRVHGVTGPPGPTGATGSTGGGSTGGTGGSSFLSFSSGGSTISDGNVLAKNGIVNTIDEFSASESAIANLSVAPLFVRLSSIPGMGNSRTFTLRRNGIDTALSVTLSDTATEGTATTAINFVAGDQLSLRTTVTAGTPLPTTAIATVQITTV